METNSRECEGYCKSYFRTSLIYTLQLRRNNGFRLTFNRVPTRVRETGKKNQRKVMTKSQGKYSVKKRKSLT